MWKNYRGMIHIRVLNLVQAKYVKIREGRQGTKTVGFILYTKGNDTFLFLCLNSMQIRSVQVNIHFNQFSGSCFHKFSNLPHEPATIVWLSFLLHMFFEYFQKMTRYFYLPLLTLWPYHCSTKNENGWILMKIHLFSIIILNWKLGRWFKNHLEKKHWWK